MVLDRIHLKQLEPPARLIVRCWVLLAILISSGGWSVSIAQTSGEDNYRRGVKAYAEGRYDEAAQIWLVEAFEGLTDAQFNLGVMYIEGKGVQQSRGEAILWFKKAAEAGHMEAQYNLGHLFLEQKENKTQVKKGIDWWRKSAESGFAIAQFNYGRALFYGIGVKQNLDQAYYWISESANNGEKVARQFLEEQSEVFAALEQVPDLLPQQAQANTDVALTTESTKKSGEISAPDQSSEVVEDDQPSPVVKGLDQYNEVGIDENADPEIEETASEVVSESTQNTLNAPATPLHHYVLVKTDTGQLFFDDQSDSISLGPIESGMLLRVVSEQSNWLEVQVPGGIPGWIQLESGERKNSFVEVNSDLTAIYPQPDVATKEENLGTANAGTKLLLLDESEGWFKIQAPEPTTAWIQASATKKVSAPEPQIAVVWQAQRLKKKIAAISSQPKTSVEPTIDPVMPPSEAQVDEQPVAVSQEFNTLFVTQPNTAIPFIAAITKSSQETVPEKNTTTENTTNGQVKEELEIVVSDLLNGQPTSGSQTENRRTSHASADYNGTLGVQGRQHIYKVKPSGAQLLTSPYENSVVLSDIRAGTLVDVVTVRENWAKASIPGGLPVWVLAKHLDIEGTVATVADDRVRVRALPGDDLQNPILGLISKGLNLPFLSQKKDWIRVLAPEWITVWVDRNDLELTDSPQDVEEEWMTQKKNLYARFSRVE